LRGGEAATRLCERMNNYSHLQTSQPPARSGVHPGSQHPLVDPQAVAAARLALCSEEELTLTADTFQILANPTRLQIVRALVQREFCVGDLAAVVGASPSAVSHHLRQLRQMRLVRHRREGKLTYYALDDDHVAKLFELGLDHVREELE
jgi:ArsR family transcriptional regulator, lead/cadmium/zinc/bismuth-responsive transcriptional repressor